MGKKSEDRRGDPGDQHAAAKFRSLSPGAAQGPERHGGNHKERDDPENAPLGRDVQKQVVSLVDVQVGVVVLDEEAEVVHADAKDRMLDKHRPRRYPDGNASIERFEWAATFGSPQPARDRTGQPDYHQDGNDAPSNQCDVT